MSPSERALRDACERADIRINGDRPWDLQVHHPGFFDRLVSGGSLGFGEAYMDGWWDAESVDQLMYRVLSHKLQDLVRISPALILDYLRAKLSNPQRANAYEVGERHYDIGNDLYAAMLDPRLTYSCGYWKDVSTLDEAQEAKLDLVCRKIGLKSGQRVLDIGSGWGSFLRYAAERYGSEGLGVTVSGEQMAYAQAHRGGLPIETRVQDYLALEGTFDHVVSIGMFEHVGYKNYRAYMEKAHSLLEDDGYFLLHTIGGNVSVLQGDPWIERYIFPHGMIPSAAQIGKAAEKLFVAEDWHNFGPYYDLTLMQWFRNFDSHWETLKHAYSERFYRMWKFYLLASAAGFRARELQLWQIVFSKAGTKGLYAAVR